MPRFGGGNKKSGQRPEAHAATVEQILTAIKIDPKAARMSMEDGFGWSFRRGSAVIEIYITQKEAAGYLQVLSPLLHLPATGLLPLYRRLLEMNLQLTSVSMGIYLDVVYIFSERPLEGLDPVEADHIISTVAAYADEWDDKLVAEFGGRVYGRI